MILDVEQLIARARTYGINVANHGFCEDFKEKVQEFDYMMK